MVGLSYLGRVEPLRLERWRAHDRMCSEVSARAPPDRAPVVGPAGHVNHATGREFTSLPHHYWCQGNPNVGPGQSLRKDRTTQIPRGGRAPCRWRLARSGL